MMGRFIERMRRNFAYKLLSLAIAILLYVIASAQRNPNRTISISVQPEVVNLPKNLAVKAVPRAEVISLTGPTAMLEIARRRIKATIDATNAPEGKSFLPVKYDASEGVQNRVEIEGAPTLEVELEQKIERRVPVKVLYENQPPPGYAYRDPTTRPSQVTVVGLASDVERVARVVAALDNSDGAGAVERVLPVVAQDERDQALSMVEVRPSRVQVALTLRKAPATKSLILSAELSGTVASGIRLSGYRFSPSSLTVRGDASALGSVSSLTVPISVDGLTKATSQRVTVAAPPGLELVGSPEVTLTLEVQPLGMPSTPTPAPTKGP